jgi:hypothetical protein
VSRGPDTHPRELLSSYLDGEFPDGSKLEVEGHLAMCAECSEWLRDLRVLAAAAHDEVPPPVPADLRRRIRVSLDAAPKAGRLIPGRWLMTHRLGLAAAGIVLILGVLTLRLDLTSSGSRAVPPPPAQNEIADSAGREDAPATSSPPPDQQPSLETRGRSPVSSRSDALRDKARAESKAPAIPRNEAGARPGEQVMAQGSAAAAAPQPLALAPGVSDAEKTPGRRPLQFEFPTFALSVSEDGTVALSAEGYSCHARLAGASVDPDIASLFAMAEKQAAGPSYAPSPAPDADTAPPSGAAEPREEAESVGSSHKRSEAPVGEEMRQRAKRLLLDRYLDLMEERCGPAPRAVRTP